MMTSRRTILSQLERSGHAPAKKQPHAVLCIKMLEFYIPSLLSLEIRAVILPNLHKHPLMHGEAFQPFALD